MSSTLLTAIILITIAWVLYTALLFVAKKKISLKAIIIILIAIISDIIGTIIMYNIREEFTLKYHSIAGTIALMSMILLFIGFTVIYCNNKANFNIEKDPKLSIIIYRITYTIWLSSYVTGFLGY